MKNIIFIGIIIITICLYKVYIDSITEFTEKFQDLQKGIILNLHHGLGNQIFIYAAALSLKKKYNISVFLLPVAKVGFGTNTHSTRDYRDIFSGVDKIEYLDKRFLQAHRFSFSNTGIYDYHNEDEIPIKNNNYIYIGNYYYQHYDNIKTVISEVRDALIPQLKMTYGDVIDNPESTAFIHIRRGDFLTEDGGTRVLPIEYYYKGLNNLNTVKNLKTIYIISDDIEWCKQHNWNTFNEIVYFNNPDELLTLYLMSQCRVGAILSNSTFSCWGALLGPYNYNGTVIHPKSGSFLKSLPGDWIGIDV